MQADTQRCLPWPAAEFLEKLQNYQFSFLTTYQAQAIFCKKKNYKDKFSCKLLQIEKYFIRTDEAEKTKG